MGAESHSEVGDPELSRAPYREAIVSVLYLAARTRPDSLVAVSILGNHVEKPTRKHSWAVKRLLRYLKIAEHVGLLFNRGKTKLARHFM